VLHSIYIRRFPIQQTFLPGVQTDGETRGERDLSTGVLECLSAQGILSHTNWSQQATALRPKVVSILQLLNSAFFTLVDRNNFYTSSRFRTGTGRCGPLSELLGARLV
jgi:hypothetical protein